ncbi:Retinol dehydrogenase 5 [Podila verticillata]|nr:Retinol dehydrogenase 5 [Podila verticillata]KAI9235160.1 MAG: hypothetical protein BYD32DRAFT_438542 [Podila humilis]KFH66852.1 hypothetical protein MVEG_07377 [Podila verticillata NRRL 6337]
MTYQLTNTDYLVVVVTGCDTGFGAEIAEELYQCGVFTIYATCLTEEAVSKYNVRDSTRLRSLKVDVTKQEDVDRLQKQVEAECPQGVYCVLNNAGAFAGGFFDFTTMQDVDFLIAVNYTGLVRITKALLPSLRTFAKSRHTLPMSHNLPRARLLSITSMAGQLSGPAHGGYCASKHAAESLLDTLRIELSPWEIDVSILEPWYAKTPILANIGSALVKGWANAHESIRQMYGPGFHDALSQGAPAITSFAMPSKWVVDAAVQAIRAKKGAQSARVLVGFWWVPLLIMLCQWMPTWMADGSTRLFMKRLGIWPSDPFLLKTKGEKHD